MHTATIHTNIKGHATAFVAVSLLMMQSGCTSVPPKTQHQASIGKVAILAANREPGIRFEGFSRSKVEGAADTGAEVLGVLLQLKEVGVILIPIILPAGAVIGAAMAPSADTVKHAENEWSKILENQTIVDHLRDQAIVAARDNDANWQPILPELAQHVAQTADYRPLVDAGIDTVLELSIANMSANGDSLDAPLSLRIHSHARLLRAKDNTEVFSTGAEYVGDRHTRSEWAANDGKMLLQALAEGCDVLGKHIYDSTFMLYPFPDQKSHFHFPERTIGLASIDPPPYFSVARVKTVHPTLRWQGFPRDSDVRVDPEDMSRVRNVRYDLFIAELHGYDPTIIYRREGLPNPEHALETSLLPGTRYAWSVRARFELDGRDRVTEWSGMATHGFVTRHFDRRFAPPAGDSYVFSTPPPRPVPGLFRELAPRLGRPTRVR